MEGVLTKVTNCFQRTSIKKTFQTAILCKKSNGKVIHFQGERRPLKKSSGEKGLSKFLWPMRVVLLEVIKCFQNVFLKIF